MSARTALPELLANSWKRKSEKSMGLEKEVETTSICFRDWHTTLDMVICFGSQRSGIFIHYPSAFLQKNLIVLPLPLRRPDARFVGKFVIDNAFSDGIERQPFLELTKQIGKI